MLNPVVYIDFAVFLVGIADKDTADSGVDNQPLAHGAAAGIFDIFPGSCFPADVSNTHLTMPTILLEKISVVPVS